MSDQENTQVKIFFDSNRFPWERQYTDGKGNWYFSSELNLLDTKEKYSFSSITISLDSNRYCWEFQYTDGKGNWYPKNRVERLDEGTFKLTPRDVKCPHPHYTHKSCKCDRTISGWKTNCPLIK